MTSVLTRDWTDARADALLDRFPEVTPAMRRRMAEVFGGTAAATAADAGAVAATCGVPPETARAVAARVPGGIDRAAPSGGFAPDLHGAAIHGRRMAERHGATAPGSDLASLRRRAVERTSDTVARLVGDLHVTVVAAAVGFAVGWIANVSLMGDRYDGFRVPAGAAATGDGNLLRGAVFWFVVSALVSGLVAYRLRVGPDRFWEDLKELPEGIRTALTEDGQDTLVHLLVGFAGAAVIVYVVGPSISAAFALGTLLLLGRALRGVATMVLMAAWRVVAGRVAPQRSRPPGPVAMLVGVVGSGAAFTVGTVLGAGTGTLVLGLAAGGAAALLARGVGGDGGAGRAAAVLLAVAAGAVLLLVAPEALADDGGFSECGNPGLIGYVFSCTGSSQVLLLSLLGGGSSATGAALGAAAAGGDPDDDRRWSDLSPMERRRAAIRSLRQRHPEMTAQEITAAVDQMLEGPEGNRYLDWLGEKYDDAKDAYEREKKLWTDGDLGLHFANALYEDRVSGQMGDRALRIIPDVLAGGEAHLGEMKDGLLEAGGYLWDNKEELAGKGMEWIKNASIQDIRDGLAALPGAAGEMAMEMTDAQIASMQQSLGEFEQAVLSGDEDKARRMMGDFIGARGSEALLGLGMGKAIQGGKGFVDDKIGSWLDGPPRRPGRGPDGPDGGSPRGPRGDGPDGGGPGGGGPGGGGPGGPGDGDGRFTFDDRRTTPYTKDELDEIVTGLRPGERVRITAEEASEWASVEDRVLHDQWDTALRYGEGDAGDRPWVEIKKGNPDAMRLREEGYVDADGTRRDYQSKPNYIENKSIKDIDRRIGAPDHLENGEVGAFKPGPEPPKGTPEHKRWVQREKEWEKVEKGRTETTGPMYDRYGREVTGRSRVEPDGHISSQHQVNDAAGRAPGTKGYKETWSDWSRVGGDTDTFMMGGKGLVTDAELDMHLRSQRWTDEQIEALTPAQRAQETRRVNERIREVQAYKDADGTVPGEGRSPAWSPDNDPNYDPLKHYTTLKSTAEEGVLLVDADGFYIARPGENYDLGLAQLEEQLRATSPGDWSPKELQQLRAYGIEPGG